MKKIDTSFSVQGQYRDNNNTKGNDRKTEKTRKPVSPQQKISTGTRGK
jgi:hypothetical protein